MWYWWLNRQVKMFLSDESGACSDTAVELIAVGVAIVVVGLFILGIVKLSTGWP